LSSKYTNEKQRDALDQTRKSHALNRDSTSASIVQMNQQKVQEQERLKALQEKVVRYVEEAKQYSEERLALVDGETVASVSQKIKELENIVNEYERTCELSFEEVVENAQKTSVEMADAQKSYDYLSQLYESLSSTQESRYLMHQNVFERTKTEIKRNFKFNLQERGFNGSLDIDNCESLLTMKIAPSSAEYSQKQDVSTLSGGEKSFTQIALLVSIWQTMKSRILALDEFDVFMDKVNREISLKLVSESLTRLNQTQSIFITPQDMDQNAIDLSDKNVRIFRMRPPVR
jgi:chromosome segregation ATPase